LFFNSLFAFKCKLSNLHDHQLMSCGYHRTYRWSPAAKPFLVNTFSGKSFRENCTSLRQHRTSDAEYVHSVVTFSAVAVCCFCMPQPQRCFEGIDMFVRAVFAGKDLV